MEQFGNFINEDQIVLSETVLDLRRELDLSTYSKAGGDADLNSAQALIEIVQCGICYSVLTPDKKPK